ncbi:hypothetical protein SK128_007117 [Halocaridina rubra]|uniref:CUB domain-containing protein n=1 Tax=Halocaridina rubra TaxID=373956 RepID=A0AAN9ABG3_HALRR
MPQSRGRYRLSNGDYTENWLAACGLMNQCKNEGYRGPKCGCICRPGSYGEDCQYLHFRDYYGYYLPPCNREIVKEGIITSPNYPVFVLEDTWCVYKIKAPEHHRVKLRFENFHIGQDYLTCHDSFLEIRDQDLSNSTMECGRSITPGEEFISSEDELVLYLDVKNKRSRGFKASVQFVAKLEALASSISSRNIPSVYYHLSMYFIHMHSLLKAYHQSE